MEISVRVEKDDGPVIYLGHHLADFTDNARDIKGDIVGTGNGLSIKVGNVHYNVAYADVVLAILAEAEKEEAQ